MSRFVPIILATACLAFANEEPTFSPFVLPWNESQSGPTDLSNWSPKPAGADGTVSVAPDGTFQVGGRRIRFLGVNLTTESCFPLPEHGEAAARRLSLFGVNSVRFHHMDASWNSVPILDYPSATSRRLNAEAFSRLHRFVQSLQKHGIYSNINLLVARTFTVEDGFPPEIAELTWKDSHILGFFDEHALSLQQEFARELLARPGPDGQTPLAQNPSVAFVEILNENGIVQKWYEGVLDHMGAPFRLQLQQRWNAWLRSKYETTAALRAAWPEESAPRGQTVIPAGIGQTGTGWQVEKSPLARIEHSVTTQGDGHVVLHINVSQTDTNEWEQARLRARKVALQPGKLYTLSFNGKANQPTQLYAHIGDSQGRQTKILAAKLRTGWSRHVASFQAPQDASQCVFTIGGINVPGDYTIADLLVQEGGILRGVPAGVSLEAANIPTVPALATSDARFSAAAERDWLKFLVDLEHRYWSTMHRYIKETLGFKGVVFGTIASNSPLSAQARLESVDGHCYWQHPKFLSGDWSLKHWIVTPQSMVEAPAASTVAQLAAQRVKGLPFTVTEYQHSSPSPYAAEAPIFAAAYGALQNWDGIWFFDYNIPATKNAVPAYQGRVRNFFDDSQHPTRLANFILAAALFRRGDVRPAEGAISAALPADLENELLRTRASPWNMPDATMAGVERLWALRHRVQVDLTASPATRAPSFPKHSDIHSSDTGELHWHTAKGKEHLRIVAANTRAVVGFVGNSTVELGDVSIAFGNVSSNWATAGVTVLEGALSGAEAARALVVATAGMKNTNQQWTDATRSSLGENWGEAPTLIETVRADLALPVEASRVTAYVLDARGQRGQQLAIRSAGGNAIVPLGSASGTLWYELVIAAKAR
jgi:hypothetical protein